MPRTDSSRQTTRVVFGVSFALLGLLGSIWAVSTPLGASPDEPTHAVRAAAVARGDVGGRSIATPSTDPDVLSLVDYAVTVPESYATSYLLVVCYVFRPDVTADCQPLANSSQTPTDTSTYVGSYPPVYYALVGWPSLWWPADPGMYVMRILSVLLGAALLALGVVCAREVDRFGGSSGFVFVGVALAITPMVIFLMSTINPSGFEVASAFATWWGGLALLSAARARAVSSADLVRFSVPAVLLAWSRPTGLVTLAAIIVTVAVFRADRASIRSLVHDRRAQAVGAATAVVVAGAGLWLIQAQALDSFLGAPVPGLTKLEAAWQSLERLPDRLGQTIGRFGWLDTPLPRTALWSWGAAVFALLLVGSWHANWRQRSGIAVVILAVVGMPTVSEALRVDEFGFIWQGRYSLPLAIGIPVLSAVALGDARRVDGRARTGIVVGTVAIVAYGQLLAHLGSARRYITGVDAPMLDFLTASTWQPPVAPGLLLAITCVVIAGYGWWFVALMNGHPAVQGAT
jgi:hypothetical protein